MSRLEVVNGRVTGWYCTQHNVYNDILTIHCCYCPELRPTSLNEHALSVDARRQGLIVEKELYEKFFNQDLAFGKQLAENASDAEITEKIRELEEICYRAKVVLIPLNEKRRKSKADTKAWLVPGDNASLNELPKKSPAARQTKMDKLRALLADLSEDGDELIVGLKAKKAEIDAAKRLVDLKSDESALCGAERHSDCTSSFIRNGEKFTCNCECHSAPKRINTPKTVIDETVIAQPLIVESEPEPAKTLPQSEPQSPKPFDFSKLRSKQ